MTDTQVKIQRPSPQKLRRAVERGPRARWWRRSGSKLSGFRYVDAQGRPIIEEAQLERIRALAIPPAWTYVRISPSPRSRLQAVGVDTSGRLQYRYHAHFMACQQEKKYARIEHFGERLPHLRHMTNVNIAEPGLSKERVLAVVIRLINDLYFRVGSEKSVRRYRTYGITTLRNRHLEIRPDGSLLFRFVGKHHIQQRRLIVAPELTEVMRQLKAVGGSLLFHYRDEHGHIHPVTPRDVNEYIKAACGPEFTAKDFRTWGGTLLAALALADMGNAESEKQIKKNLVQAVKRVAERLGNTPTVCRECYIHPVVFERYRQGMTLEDFRPKKERIIGHLDPEYHPEEIALLKLIRACPDASAKAAEPGREHVSRAEAEERAGYSPSVGGTRSEEAIRANAAA
ncbi:MAG TPA: hypothetical protein VFA07_17895 [Chthonomonadaceae bacterium]|nr:hypothetical protein [Chthonomonadaceae bacterium]